MSDAVHLLVPFAACAGENCLNALRGLQLPHLQRLLRRLVEQASDQGSADSLSPPHERALARLHGLEATQGLIPLAALQVQQQRPGSGHDAWAWITPAHWRVGRGSIEMGPPQELQLDAQEARALVQAMQPWFAEDAITLEVDTPLRWLARGEIFRSLPTASLDRVIGRDVDAWMPAGPTGRVVRRLQQEMQMLLYTLPLNDERQRGGRLPVNSFWVSGTGALPPQHVAQEPAGLLLASGLREAALAGDWPAWAAAWQELDAREGARLLDAATRAEVRVTLCGEANARSWSSAGAGAWHRATSLFNTTPVTRLLETL